MSLYLAWGVIPYIVIVGMALATLFVAFKCLNVIGDDNKCLRRLSKVLALLAFVFIAQFPWKYSTPYFERLTFDKGVEYNNFQVEQNDQAETWDQRTLRLKDEARQAADNRLKKALSETPQKEQ